MKAGKVADSQASGLIASTVAANVMTLAATVLAVRVIGAADYAAYGVLTGVAAVAAVVVTWRLDQFLLLRSVTSPGVVFRAACLATLAGALLFAAVIVALPLLSWIFDLERSRPLAALTGALTAAVAFQTLTTNMAMRQEDHRFLNFSRVLRAVILLTVAVGVLRMWPTVSGFLTATVVATLAPLLFFGWSRIQGKEAESRSQWRNARSFIGYNLPTALITVLNQQLPIFFFFVLYIPAVAGEIGLAYKLILMPLSLVGVALGQIVTLAYHRAGNLVAFRASFVKTLRLLCVAALFVILVFALTPWDLLTKFVFPDLGALEGFLILFAPVLALFAVSGPLSGVLSLEGRVRTAFWISVVEGIARVAALVVASSLSDDPVVGVAAFVVVSALISINYLAVTSRHVLGSRAFLPSQVIVPIGLVAVGCATLMFSTVVTETKWIAVLVAVVGVLGLWKTKGGAVDV